MKLTRMLIVLGAVLVLGAVNYGIASKEAIKRNGQTIFLKLAPIDPRSLMQGDYMALRFVIAADIERQIESIANSANAPLGRGGWNEGKIGTVPITLDSRGVAQVDPGNDTDGGLRLRYRVRSGRIWLGTNAFFFAEGDAKRYRDASFGEFKLDRASGEAVLVGLSDAQLKPL